jgi:hypothetical protein
VGGDCKSMKVCSEEGIINVVMASTSFKSFKKHKMYLTSGRDRIFYNSTKELHSG